MVEIVPNLKMDALNLLCGDFGPFALQIATQVPLWLAVALKRRGKCSIRPPEWMSVEKLTQVLEAEQESQEMSEKLPFHYVEISRLLFDHACDDIPDVYMVRSLIEDTRDVRFHKVETDLEAFNGRTVAVKFFFIISFAQSIYSCEPHGWFFIRIHQAENFNKRSSNLERSDDVLPQPD